MTADTVLFKTDFNWSTGMPHSFMFRCARLPKLPIVLDRIARANLHLRKLKICSYDILYYS